MAAPALAARRPLVSICIPAYRSDGFIGAVMEGALGQSVGDIEIVVSNDGGIETPALAAYAGHPKVTIRDRPRLGWVRNTNAALQMARGAYFMVLPHDDLLAPTYVEACLDLLESDAAAFAATSDIALPDRVVTAPEVRGGLRRRADRVMRDHFGAYSYRALMRRMPRHWNALRLRENPPTNFACDTTWILQQAMVGELRRVPQTLYAKGRHDANTSAHWREMAPEMLRGAWARHCAAMAEILRGRLSDEPLIERLVAFRSDPRRVPDAPRYLRDAFGGGRLARRPGPAAR